MSISSLVGLVHLCFELVLAPEILVMIEDHRRRGCRWGFFLSCKGCKCLNSDFKVQGWNVSNSPKKMLRHFLEMDSWTAFSSWLQSSAESTETFNNFWAEKGISRSLHWYECRQMSFVKTSKFVTHATLIASVYTMLPLLQSAQPT